MAYVYIFKLPHGGKAQYDSVAEQLRKEGVDNPVGRLYHFAGPMDSGWQITDIWESKEHFEEFQKNVLLPILERLHIQMPTFEVSTADIMLDNTQKKT